MLVVDSSVRIDSFNDADQAAVDLLEDMLDEAGIRIVVPDLVPFEQIRGLRAWRH